jgi:hypothetical protein
MTYRAQARVERLRFDPSRRQELFSNFVVAGSKLYGDALMSSEPPLQEVVAVCDDQPDSGAVLAAECRVRR